jgi:hypothetical protein
MRLLAEWIPTTPEMEVKVLFGRHVWDCARHADAFGRRAFELRAPMHYTLPPAPAYDEWLQGLARSHATADRVAALYDVFFPALQARYTAYLETTDPLMDEPSVRIIQSAAQDLQRMAADRARLLEGIALGAASLDARGARERERALETIVEHGSENMRAKGMRA